MTSAVAVFSFPPPPWLDGAYGWEPGRGQPEFHAQREVNDGDVQQLVQRIRDRVLRALRKAGKRVDADAAADSGDGVGDELLPGLAAAAVEGRAALGMRAGQGDGRIGRDGLVELSDGRIGYSLKKRWRDGTTAVVMTKEVLMERLCALVPKPRKHLVTYHGVLAPASLFRSRVVPRRVEEEGEAVGCQHGAGGGTRGCPADWSRWTTPRSTRSTVRGRTGTIG